MRRKLEKGAARLVGVEYADTGRPITGALTGAPSNGFTVYGAHVPARLGVVRLPLAQLSR